MSRAPAAEEDFRDFVANRQRQLLRSAWLLTGDWGAAEDLVQTALLHAWRHWPRVMRSGGADAYVRTVLLNCYRRSWRRRWHGEVSTGAVPDEVGLEVDVSSRVGLRRAIGELPPRQRAVVVLRYFDGLSVEETAAVMSTSEGTVKSQTSKALAQMRRSAHLDRSEIHEP